MIERVLRKYRAEGFRGLHKAIMRRLFPPPHPVNIALQEIRKSDAFMIIQIGAYVGNTSNDPLFHMLKKHMLSGRGTLIVVEPVREIFAKLVENYRDIPGVRFENVAISDRSGPVKFYRLGVDPVAHGYPEWLSQLGSLKEERMGLLWDKCEANDSYKAFYLKHRIEETVDCITFSELLHRHRVLRIDLLQLDVEGFELEILRTINFEQTPVRFVNYECVLLHERKMDADMLMEANGYRVVDFAQDSFCYRNADRHLIDRWSRFMAPGQLKLELRNGKHFA